MADRDSTPYGVIYCIEHTESGKKYIGQTTQSVTDRWRAHAKAGSYCVLLSRSIQKYGESAFSMSIIDSADSKDSLNEKEIAYIAKFGTTDRSKGFNLREGGSFGKHCEESKKKMSASVLKAYKNPQVRANFAASRIGMKKRTAECFKKIALALTGKSIAAETKQRISDTVTGLWESEEYRAKVSIGQKEGRSSVEYKSTVSNNSKSQWADPIKRKALLEARAAVMNDPVRHAEIMEKRRASRAAKKLASTLL